MKYRFLCKDYLESKFFQISSPLLLSLAICLGITSNVSAQHMSCGDHLNVSLNADCEYQVNPSTVLTGGGIVDAEYTVMLEDKKGAPIDDDVLRFEHLGQTITVKVIDNSTSNSCWGTLLVEDKKPPTISCGTVNATCLDADTHLPDVFDNCDPEVIAVPIGSTTTLSDCDPMENIVKTIMTEYVAQDSDGRRSASCTHIVSIEGINTDHIVYPDDLIDDDSFICNSDFPLDENGNPHPDTTGIPFLVVFDDLGVAIDSLSLWPEITELCKARMTYDDTVIGAGSCRVKIMRRWSFFDACTSVDAEPYIQMIYIEDNVGPNIDCPETLTLIGSPVNGQSNPSGGSSSCVLAVNIPSVTVSDNCTTVQFVGVDVDGDPTLSTNGGTIIVSPGPHVIEYSSSDGCNISENCVTNIEVIDNSPPVAICDRHSVIGLTVDGTVEVEASVFDDGSFDVCGIGDIHIKRLGTGICDSSDFEFGPTVTFCCEDEGTKIDATVRVYDLAGAFSECDVSIEIQDKTPSNGTCPPAFTIDCDHPLDLNDLSEFGEAVSNNRCRAGIEEIDPIIDLGSCNNGTITRQWIEAASGAEVICTQTITISNPYTFDFDNLNQIVDRPRNIDTTGACGLSLLPENLPPGAQRPEILDDNNSCDLIGTTYKDEEFSFDDGTNACLKIIRTWTILNWCAPDGENTLELAQIIKVTDTSGPEITLDPFISSSICNETDNCESGIVSLSATATDNCTTNLTARVLIDLDNDGIINDTIAIETDSTAQGDRATLETSFPIGSHRVQFVFVDACGLVSAMDHVFTLQNCKAPTCVLKNLNINLRQMDQGSMECIWASDFDASSVANCPGEDLSFYFDADFSQPNLCVTCTDLGTQTLDLYVVDGFGNHAICQPMLTVTDHSDLCPSMIEGDDDVQSISGLIENHNGGNVPDAMVELRNTEYAHKMSDNTGAYAFNQIESNKDYTVQVGKDDDHMNGVSTLDLVLIQKHILGIEILDDPYNIIAADINKSGNISAIDLVELRKLILGEQNSFTSNTSWRFVDKTYEFQNPLNPLNEIFAEQYEITNLSNDMKVDFIGVKVGDVSGNASFENLMLSEARSNKTLQLFQEEELSTGSNIMELEISADEFSQVHGFQTTFSFDASALEYIGVEGDAIEVTSNNVGRRYVDKGLISLSWSSPEEVTVSDKVLFKFIFQLKGEVQQGLKINSQITTSEVYYAGKVSKNIVLGDKIGNLILDQNVPNPWFDQTEISFEVAESAEVKFKVYDLFGKQVHVESLYANDGDNKIELDRKDIPAAGIYFYELTSGSQKVINKMIVIE